MIYEMNNRNWSIITYRPVQALATEKIGPVRRDRADRSTPTIIII
jgi:hypothetical protein